MSRIARRNHQGNRGFPRVSGDEPEIDYQKVFEPSFSPRERG